MAQVQSTLSPVTIIIGGNTLLRERTVRKYVEIAQHEHPDRDLIQLDALTCDHYSFEEAVSPSLFSASAIVLLDHLEEADEKLAKSLVSFCETAADNSNDASTLICQHSGGNKGKRLLTELGNAKAIQEKVPDIKTVQAKETFVFNEFQRYGRKIEPYAVHMLVSILGGRLDELASMCEQLCFDFDVNPIPASVVEQYLTDSPQGDGFKVADLALAGNGAQSIISMRQALEQGTDVLAIVGAITYKIRTLAQAAACKSGSISRRDLGIGEWQLRQADKQLVGWTSAGLASVIKALAQVDEQCKGRGGDPLYTLEQIISSISQKGGQTSGGSQ